MQRQVENARVALETDQIRTVAVQRQVEHEYVQRRTELEMRKAALDG